MRADSLTVERPVFQPVSGGSNPTSALQLFVTAISRTAALRIYEQHHYLHAKPMIASVHYGAL